MLEIDTWYSNVFDNDNDDNDDDDNKKMASSYINLIMMPNQWFHWFQVVSWIY